MAPCGPELNATTQTGACPRPGPTSGLTVFGFGPDGHDVGGGSTMRPTTVNADGEAVGVCLAAWVVELQAARNNSDSARHELTRLPIAFARHNDYNAAAGLVPCRFRHRPFVLKE